MTIEPTSSKPFLSQLSELIDEVCKQGQTVNDIAIRAGLSRDLVSRLRNRSYRSAPSLSNIEAVCQAIGHRLALVPIDGGRETRQEDVQSES
ncbi:MAG: helix-turn-helix domain-containing protein [Pirellula sp.]